MYSSQRVGQLGPFRKPGDLQDCKGLCASKRYIKLFRAPGSYESLKPGMRVRGRQQNQRPSSVLVFSR